MKVFIRENTWLSREAGNNFGWGNGYVLIPNSHPLYGKQHEELSIEVHGGLAFSELITEELAESWGLDTEDIGKWCFGFNTGHCFDTLYNWPKERVQAEAEELRNQLMKYVTTWPEQFKALNTQEKIDFLNQVFCPLKTPFWILQLQAAIKNYSPLACSGLGIDGVYGEIMDYKRKLL